MNTETEPITVLSDSACGLLAFLGRAGVGAFQFEYRGFADYECRVSTAFEPRDLLPMQLIRLLEEDSAGLTVGLAIRRSTVDRELAYLAAVTVAFRFERIYQDSAWQNPVEQLAAAQAKVEAFGLPPTMTLQEGTNLFVIWALQEPLALPEHEALALDLHRRLAAAVGAIVLPDAVSLADIKIPVPGSSIANQGRPGDFVFVPYFDRSRHYTAAELARCLTTTAKRKTK